MLYRSDQECRTGAVKRKNTLYDFTQVIYRIVRQGFYGAGSLFSYILSRLPHQVFIASDRLAGIIHYRYILYGVSPRLVPMWGLLL